MNRLLLLRLQRGLRQVDVAEATGLHARTLQRLETGRTHRPEPPTAKRLADFYGINILELLEPETPEVV